MNNTVIGILFGLPNFYTDIDKLILGFLDDEDKSKPLTDDKLALILKKKTYNIARRTVAKYREQLGIPVARLRKEL